MESIKRRHIDSNLAEQSIQFHKQSLSEEKEEVGTIQRRVEIVHDYFSTEAECCVPSGLSYCNKCDSGPSCCVYLSDEDDSSDPTSSSVDDAGHVNKRAKRDGEEQEEKVDYDEEEGVEEEEDEVINFYLSGEGMGEGCVEEYVFYVDEDEDDDDEGDEHYVDFRGGDEGEGEYYEDAEGRYEEEDEEGEYVLDDEGEYFVDSDEDEWEEEMEEEEQQRQKRARRSRDHFFPRYQEPLEVILEILGEEGEEEEEENQSDSNNKEEDGGNGDEDLITFSSSSDFSPDSLEEVCARKAKDDVQNPATEEDVSQQTSDDSLTPRNTSMDDIETIAYTRLPEDEEEKEDSHQSFIQNLMDEPILEDCPQIILPRPSLIKASEETDREKLRALTSEIEAYLKETTMLLESATTYTSATKSREKGSKESPDEGQKIESKKCSDSVAKEPSSVHATLPLRSDKPQRSAERKIEEPAMPSPLSTTVHGNLETTRANRPSDIQPAEDPKQTHDATVEIRVSPPAANQLPKIKSEPPGNLEGDSRGLTASHESQVSEGEHKSLFKSVATDVSHASTRLTDSPDIYKSLLETHNLAETEYYSAVETSTEVLDALEWEDKEAKRKDKKQPRIIYKPDETTQGDDICFTSPRNRRTWLAAFEELEDSFDSAIKSGEKQPSDVCNTEKAENEAASDASETPKITDAKQSRRRCESPPPTISCLENLEKLCRRLSLEREKYSEQMCTIDRPSPVGMEDNSYACSEDNEMFSTSTISETENDITADKPYTVRMAGQKGDKENSGTNVHHLDNIIKGDLNQNKPEFHHPLAKETGCAFKENGGLASAKENEKTRARWDTKETLKFQYIDSKLDEIFSSVEDEVSHTTYSNLVNQMVKGQAKIQMRSHDDTLYASGKQVQKQLNEILNGMDSMYESYLKKRKSLDLTHEPKNFTDLKFPEGNIFRTKAESPDATAEKRRETKSELDAFRDIIDISEDLKNLCVFHVNKPGWDSAATDPHSRSPTPREGADVESSFPDFYESDGATPEAEAKEFVPDGKPRDSPSHVRDPCRRSSKEWEGEAGVGSFLATMKEENLRCYKVTLDYLQKISASQGDTGERGNTNGDDVITLPANHRRQTEDKNMSALQLAAEGRDYLMWCPDQEFDHAVAALDIRGLVELVQTLQDAMAVEQQTFDSLTQQLELVTDPLQQQRLSAALCTSQTRLARLCSRNMRCFTQQALKARQKDSPESRSSSPRDSGLVMSSAAASDAEADPRSPTGGASFKNSLAFFQRAAHLVANNTKNSHMGNRQKESRRRSSRGSSCYGSSSSEAWSVTSDDPNGVSADLINGYGLGGGGGGGGGDYLEDDLNTFEDQGTYEQVLFINGRPQYQDDVRSSNADLMEMCQTSPSSASLKVQQEHQSRGRHSSPSGERSRSSSYTRVRIDGSTGSSVVVSAAGPASDPQPQSVAHSYGSLPRRSSAASHAAAAAEYTAAAEAQTQTSEGDFSGYVTLPRRKPYLNFKSVSCGSNANNSVGSEFDNEDLSYFKERVGILRNCGVNSITRTQSFKEGLNCYSHEYSNTAYGLSRTQSFHDGLAGDFNALESGKTKLQRAPSVDEILESVKTLRARKTMVKSTPDLLSPQEPVYHSASLPRHKGSKGKGSRAAGTSSLLGVRYNGPSSNESLYERVPEPDYEQIPESLVGGTPYYENVCRGNNHYENIHLKGEVIYDSPRPTDHSLHHHYDKVHGSADLHYENVKFDAPVYENVDEKEPTYMNVNGTSKSGNVYANIDTGGSTNKKTGSLKSSKSRSNKVTISGNSMMQGTTYDVPRAATHIYDSPQRQVRSVASTQANEYDTPKNNRSILPQSTQIVLKAKHDQKSKIDDIFADCDKDSLEGDRDREPDIPSPDYGSEEEGDGYEDAANDYVSAEFPDEGLGESDNRSYYAEDPAGLEVILEEPEEDYCSSHGSEDDLQRDVDITHELKGERRSLDGSEGIGSAEGDSHSSGGSEHYGEEDCASSGIHSEDTPSPGPPVEPEKEDHHHQDASGDKKREEDRIQKDRCIEVYPETVRQRQRNMMASANKVDIKNWNSGSGSESSQNSPSKVKKFLPSVKALRNQFETGKTSNGKASETATNGHHQTSNGTNGSTLNRKTSSSTSSLASSTLEKTSSTTSLNSGGGSCENLLNPASAMAENGRSQQVIDPDEPVEPIFNQFKKVDEELRELMSKPPSTSGWNPRPLLKRLYYIPDAPKVQSQGTTYVNIEGYLEKLPSGRKKATFWNAWKRRYFVAKEGVLYYYQNPQADKPSMKMTLMGGKVECMEPNMVGVDDGKGHYVVVRCSSRQEAERWRRALETHTVEDFASQYVQPWPVPNDPALLRDTLVIDLGSCSVRAGVLASQATLPQLFLPSVVATERESRRQIWGYDSLAPDVRAASTISFPVRPSHKITKYSVDLSAVSSLLQKTFADLRVDPKNYHLQLSVPRVLNSSTQTELLRVLFDKFGVKSVNLTHQSILALYAYNATSGIVVDIGERMDIVPVIDGYIVDGGVSRVPYGGYRILDHLRQFLYMRNVSLINEVESYIIRHVLENICYCAHHYNTEKARCANNPDNFEKGVSLSEYFHNKDCPYDNISLDFGRFQATEGLFNPDAWGLDHPGLHKLVYKAIMECSMDIRKEMSRSIFLAGGVTQLPGLVDRLTTEIDNLTPPAIRPKVHASPYRYHAAYIGACVLAESPGFVQSRVTREEWNKQGPAALRKWSL